jgi:ABC-2 type transport system permease protein
MNRQHLKTFLWLRWRLAVNQIKRAGAANFVILMILIFIGGMIAISMFFIALIVGLFTLREAPPFIVMTVWDGIVLVFLFFWMMGLLVELQRSELLSMDRFLHLPVSLNSVFLLNYLGSLINLPMIAFLPGMLGLCIAMVFTKGPALLLLFPVLAAFLLMINSLTHQFRGWLASLMTNKRRRRTVVVILTMTFILLAQIPNLINVFHPWTQQFDDGTQLKEQLAELDRELSEKKIDAQEYSKRRDEVRKQNQEEAHRREQQTWQSFQDTSAIINIALPIGWLPLSAMTLTKGSLWPAVLVTLGMTLVGVFSLRRSYRTTMRIYKGEFTSGKAKRATAVPSGPAQKASAGLLDKQLPWLPERVSAVALASFRSILRAPEAKMLLLTPIILVLIFGGSVFAGKGAQMPLYLRPLMAFGAFAMVMLMMVQLVGNQFAFDRSGFRTYVLCAAPRRDILLGKNLAFVPFALTLCVAMIVVLQLLRPMRFDLFLACLPQMVCMYFLFCMVANWLSILAPIPVQSGSMKPMNPKGGIILLQVLFTFLFPMALSPTLLPLGIDFALEEFGWRHGVPVALLLSLLLAAGVILLYRKMLTLQGQALQAREKKILETVTSKME